VIIPPDVDQEVVFLKMKKQHMLWYFSKVVFSFVITLMFWSQLAKLENKYNLQGFVGIDLPNSGTSTNLKFLRVYIYLNMLEYILTVIYHCFIIFCYDRYHTPTQEEINDGLT
jgi:hypothetical protein